MDNPLIIRAHKSNILCPICYNESPAVHMLGKRPRYEFESIQKSLLTATTRTRKEKLRASIDIMDGIKIFSSHTYLICIIPLFGAYFMNLSDSSYFTRTKILA